MLGSGSLSEQVRTHLVPHRDEIEQQRICGIVTLDLGLKTNSPSQIRLIRLTKNSLYSDSLTRATVQNLAQPSS